jgi:hypothetical protein
MQLISRQSQRSDNLYLHAKSFGEEVIGSPAIGDLEGIVNSSPHFSANHKHSTFYQFTFTTELTENHNLYCSRKIDNKRFS